MQTYSFSSTKFRSWPANFDVERGETVQKRDTHLAPATNKSFLRSSKTSLNGDDDTGETLSILGVLKSTKGKSLILIESCFE